MGLDANILASDVYDDLKACARRYLRSERANHTLQPTALVHEAYLKLAKQGRVSWQSRTHFFGVAATAMRRLLVDHARARATQKRGSGRARMSLDEACLQFEQNDIDILDLDLLLTEFAELDARACRIVEYQFFAGLTQAEIAEILNVSVRTVSEDWKIAQRWLAARLATG